jgi:hypothetical protein
LSIRAAASNETDRDALTEQRASLAKEITKRAMSATKTSSGPATSAPHDPRAIIRPTSD